MRRCRGEGGVKEEKEGRRRVEVSGEEVRKEEVKRKSAGGKNREKEEEEDMTG